MKDVNYNATLYQIHNHFFPYLISEVRTWEIKDLDIAITITNTNDRFVAKWITVQNLSAEALLVFDLAKSIYKFYFNHLAELRTGKFKIQTWDAGWWQIRNVLADENLAEDLMKGLKVAHNLLKEKLLPQVYEYGFLEVEKLFVS